MTSCFLILPCVPSSFSAYACVASNRSCLQYGGFNQSAFNLSHELLVGKVIKASLGCLYCLNEQLPGFGNLYVEMLAVTAKLPESMSDTASAPLPPGASRDRLSALGSLLFLFGAEVRVK